MEVIPEPENGTASVLVRSNILFVTKNPYAVMSGTGDTDYVCGACKVALAAKVNRGQIANMVLRCPACKSFNAIRGS
jgi:DNA-directed RNA polymerase subunit RPC12/RpoP